MSFKTPYRVIYADTDQMGIVYHANYLRYFEIGRTEMLRACGFSYRDMEENDTLLQVVECSMKFHAPARYDDLVDICCEIAKVGTASITIANEVRLGEKLLVSGAVRLAAVSGKTHRITPLPAALMEALKQNQG